MFLHGICDTLDTLEWTETETIADLANDWLNFFDGLFFVLGLASFIGSFFLTVMFPLFAPLTKILNRLGLVLMGVGVVLAFVLSWIVNIFKSIELTMIIFGILFLIALTWYSFKGDKKRK